MLGISRAGYLRQYHVCRLGTFGGTSGKELQVEVEILQSNHEGTLVDEIQRAYLL